MRLTYVTGVSGAGKTTVGEVIAERATGASGDHPYIVDLDGNGTPNAGHLDWLRWRAAELLHEATELAESGDGLMGVERMYVVGICWPHAVVDSNAWLAARRAKVEVEFVMLDVPHKVIRRRLRERHPDGYQGKEKDFADLLRYNRDLARVIRHQVENQRYGHVLAAEHQSPGMLADWLIDSGPAVARWPIIGGGE